jgi:hypothetical protein
MSDNDRNKSWASTVGGGAAKSYTPEELAEYRQRVMDDSVARVRKAQEERAQRQAQAKQSVADALTAVEKNKAWQAYQKAGGTEEQFEKAWPALSESIRQQKVLDAFKRPDHEPIIKGI